MLTNEERATYVAVKSAAQAINHNLSTIDWEQRRYEIAKDFATRMYAASCYDGSKSDAIMEGIEFADELIKQLKETQQ